MSSNLNNQNPSEFFQQKTNIGINGLDNYLDFLEFHYFSKISLRNYSINDQGIDMALDMTCSIDLLEMLAHFNKNRWGKSTNIIDSPLLTGFNHLAAQNSIYLDIEELTLFLNDTSIIIKRISDRSILQQFNDILTELANHYIYFTQGLTQQPYEIFVPVFEDDIDNPPLNTQNKKPQSYFDFWGIYLDNQEDALIYDLNRNTFIPADLDLSMH